MTPNTDNKDGIKYPTNTGQNPMDLDKLIILMEKVIIPAFALQIVRHCVGELNHFEFLFIFCVNDVTFPLIEL